MFERCPKVHILSESLKTWTIVVTSVRHHRFHGQNKHSHQNFDFLDERYRVRVTFLLHMCYVL